MKQYWEWGYKFPFFCRIHHVVLYRIRTGILTAVNHNKSH